MPQAPQEALQPGESPSVPLSSLHLTGSVLQVALCSLPLQPLYCISLTTYPSLNPNISTDIQDKK